MKTPDMKIAERLNAVPAAYRGCYRRATSGNSLRAAVNAFCLECMGWQRTEVVRCTASACPLFRVRPYQGSAQDGHDGPDSAPGLSNDPGRVD